jgi:Flp pilus assembly pilin Flp
MTTDTIRNAKDEAGQTMAEYTVVLSVIIFVTVAIFMLLGDTVATTLNLVTKVFP